MRMEKQKSRKVGLFGGTFDPIHLGHLLTVNHVRQRVGLDSVHLVPAARPVHRSQPVASEQHRMEMVRLAVDDFPGLVADDRELRRQGKSYSIDTICSLRLDYPDVRFALIVGMDQALAFDSWHRWEEILDQVDLIVMQRPDTLAPESKPGWWQEREADDLSMPRGAAKAIIVVPVPQLWISGTALRRAISRGDNLSHQLTPGVLNYINQFNLYRSNQMEHL